MSAMIRKIPTRRCCGCGESFPKKDLLRVIRAPDGTVSLDFTGKKSGRGAYVCRSSACFRKARRSDRLSRSLECTVPEDVLDALEAEIRLSESESENEE